MGLCLIDDDDDDDDDDDEIEEEEDVDVDDDGALHNLSKATLMRQASSMVLGRVASHITMAPAGDIE